MLPILEVELETARFENHVGVIRRLALPLETFLEEPTKKRLRDPGKGREQKLGELLPREFPPARLP